MANEQRLQSLAERLTDLTEQKKVKWTAANPYRFQLSVPSGAVAVTMIEDLPEMFVYDDDGNLIESLAESRTTTQPWDKALNDLWTSARNSALNIDQLLESILKDVENAADSTDDIPL
jgi:hypothetical protein